MPLSGAPPGPDLALWNALCAARVLRRSGEVVREIFFLDVGVVTQSLEMANDEEESDSEIDALDRSKHGGQDSSKHSGVSFWQDSSRHGHDSSRHGGSSIHSGGLFSQMTMRLPRFSREQFGHSVVEGVDAPSIDGATPPNLAPAKPLSSISSETDDAGSVRRRAMEALAGDVPTSSLAPDGRHARRGSSLLASSIERVIAEPGAALCEVAFVFGVRQHAVLTARERTICLALSRADYRSVIGEFTGEGSRVQGNVLEQVRARGSSSDATAEELQELMEQRKQSALFDLLNAASDGEVESVRALLQGEGENAIALEVDESDYDMRTALHVSASEGQVSVVETLIAARANVNAKDRWGGTPLADAVRQGAERVAQLLIKAGGKLDMDEAKISGELCWYAQAGKKEAIGHLIQAGSSVNASDYDKRTCLHVAAAEGNEAIVKLLVMNGAKLNVKDRWGGALRAAARARARCHSEAPRRMPAPADSARRSTRDWLRRHAAQRCREGGTCQGRGRAAQGRRTAEAQRG